MNTTEINAKKRRVDIRLASEIVGITPKNASAAYRRPGSKYHERIVSALADLIKAREEVISKALNACKR